VAKGLARVCDKPYHSGSSAVSILVLKINGKHLKIRDQEI
jgi:hypothetical protein